MSKSPLSQKTNNVTFELLSNGVAIESVNEVLSIKICRSVNEIPYCEIEILDGGPRKEGFPISESKTFIPGAKIELKVGYEFKNSTLFKGIVVKQNLRISSQGILLKILCKDETVKMSVGRKNAYFKEMTDSAIINKIIGNNGLMKDVTSTEYKLKQITQYYTTDWDFVLSRADANGMITIVQDGKVSVIKPDDVSGQKLELTYGKDIIEFDADLDAQDQLNSIQADAWDMKSQSIISGKATPSNFEMGDLSTSKLASVIGLDKFNLQSSGGAMDETMLKSLANAKAAKSKFAKIRGTVKFQGSASAVPGTLIGIKGLGKRFDGNGFVSGVVHELREGNWFSTVKLGLSPQLFSEQKEEPVKSGLLSNIQGLQIGKVVESSNDPSGEFRVLIHLPLIHSGNETVWARMSSFYASSNAGAFFYPEVDDEVVIGFLNGDPRDAIVLGSMYSSAKPAPVTSDNQNNTKAFVSREKMKISFDETKKEITVVTPGNNKLVLSDEGKSLLMSDQNKNFIKLSPAGIELHSETDIKIKAKKSVTIDGLQGINGSAAGGKISLKGTEISADANTTLNLRSNASSTLSSSGQVTVKGAMVMIN